MQIEVCQRYKENIRNTMLHFIIEINPMLLHHMIKKLISMIKYPSDNEDRLRGILNKWIGREVMVNKMCFDVVDKINDDYHIEKTHDQVISFLDFYVNREFL